MRLAHSGVNIHGLDIRMRNVIKTAAVFFNEVKEELVITSARDGIHSPGSYHYYGYAVDIRTRHLSSEEKIEFELFMKAGLSSYYDVVLHKTHLHVEFDVDRFERNFSKKGD